MAYDARAVRSRLKPLVKRVWQHFDDVGASCGVVRPSMPILFFGHLDAYLDSPTRILTVGLNPSNAEFPSDDPFKRFPAAGPGGIDTDAIEANLYLNALSRYFEETPYSRWFSTSFGKMLAGFDASFKEKDGRPNRAIHTDLFSCLATSPTWSGLEGQHPGSHTRLMTTGIDLWHDLVEALAPDVVLMSFAPSYLVHVRHVRLTDLKPTYEVQKPSGLAVIKHAKAKLGEKDVLWVWGSSGRMPFLRFNGDEKHEITKSLVRAMKVKS